MPEPKKQQLGTLLKQLEKIVDELSSDTIDLEDSVKKYEQGLRIASEVKKQLQHVENKVEKIRKQFSQQQEKTDKSDEEV